MTKPELRVIIRQWVRSIVPSLRGEYTFNELYTHLRGLFNNDQAWDTIGTTCSIGDYMVRMEVLRAKRLSENVTRVAPGVYNFA